MQFSSNSFILSFLFKGISRWNFPTKASVGFYLIKTFALFPSTSTM